MRAREGERNVIRPIIIVELYRTLPRDDAAFPLSPEQTVRRAGLDLAVPIAGRYRRWLRLARRSLYQRWCSGALPRAGRRGSRHHLDAGALPRRVERLLEQAQDQPYVTSHRVLQRRHLSRQLVDPSVDLLHRSAWTTLKVTWKGKRSRLAATRSPPQDNSEHKRVTMMIGR